MRNRAFLGVEKKNKSSWRVHAEKVEWGLWTKKRMVKRGNDSARWFHIMKNISAVAPESRRREKVDFPNLNHCFLPWVGDGFPRPLAWNGRSLFQALESVSSTFRKLARPRVMTKNAKKRDVRLERAFSQSRVWKEEKGPFEGKIGLAGTTCNLGQNIVMWTKCTPAHVIRELLQCLGRLVQGTLANVFCHSLSANKSRTSTREEHW